MADATRPSVSVAAPPAPVRAPNQSAIVAQATSTQNCQAPESSACTGEELLELKRQLSSEQPRTAPPLNVSSVASDPAKAIDGKSLDPTTASIILLP
jgi:hypothetical protein